jgi:hypothetical protein
VIFCCGDFDLFLRFFGKIPFFQPSILVVKDYKHALLGMFLQLMFFQQLLDLIASSKWFLRSSKPCVAMMYTSAPLLCYLFSVFKLYWTTNNRSKDTTRKLFDVILFSFFFSFKLSFFYTTNYLSWYDSHMRSLGVFFGMGCFFLKTKEKKAADAAT